MREALKLLVAAGFTDAEIQGFVEENRLAYIASGVVSLIRCKPWEYQTATNTADPLDALSKMTEGEKREVRDHAAQNFDEFVMEEQS
jgi:hypothetical protein